MRLGPHVNHREALQAFRSALNGNPICLITIAAPSGKGKSRLVRRFIEECEATKISCALVDFRDNPEYNYADVVDEFRRFLNDLGFVAYQRVLEEIIQNARSEVILRENVFTQTVVGNITADLDPETRQLIRRQLSRAFLQGLEDIAKKKRVVILFDTYEKASQDVKKWITGLFLNAIRKIDKLIVVIAGKEIPDLDSPHWAGRVRSFTLNDLSLDDWYEYAKLTGALQRIPQELLQEYYSFYHGDPQSMRVLCDPFVRANG